MVIVLSYRKTGNLGDTERAPGSFGLQWSGQPNPGFGKEDCFSERYSLFKQPDIAHLILDCVCVCVDPNVLLHADRELLEEEEKKLVLSPEDLEQLGEKTECETSYDWGQMWAFV